MLYSSILSISLLFVSLLQENIRRNFGMPQPNGYRKAMRFMRHANKFGLPIVTLVDTPGAYAGKAAEELGQVRMRSSPSLSPRFKFKTLPIPFRPFRKISSHLVGSLTGRGYRLQPEGDVWAEGPHPQSGHRRGRLRRRSGHWVCQQEPDPRKLGVLRRVP